MDIAIDLTNIILETPRLYLRCWRQEDLEDFYAYASVPGVGEMAGWKHHASMEESKRILDSFISEKNIFALVWKPTGKVIGSLGLHPSWASSEPEYQKYAVKEIGYVLSKDYWGQGIMPEAVTAVIRFCFEKLSLAALTVGHFEENLQSRRVIEKCGFRFVKNSVYGAKDLGKSFPNRDYILLNPEKQH